MALSLPYVRGIRDLRWKKEYVKFIYYGSKNKGGEVAQQGVMLIH
jgi:hypothetical protein